jgi:hypothetical protein
MARSVCGWVRCRNTLEIDADVDELRRCAYLFGIHISLLEVGE